MQAVLDDIELLDALNDPDEFNMSVVEACRRCHLELPPGVPACPSCAWPIDESFPPHPPEPHHDLDMAEAEALAAMAWQRSGTEPQIPEPERFSWWWAVLGFILPIVGLVYGFAGRRRNPVAAHAALIGGLIGAFLLGLGGILEVVN